MKTTNEKNVITELERVLPERLLARIFALGEWRRDFPYALSEIRIRRNAAAFAVLCGECLPLGVEATDGEIDAVYRSVLSGSLYAHTAELKEGFITLNGGVRVGICGDARYEEGQICSISDVSALVFRLPLCESENAADIYRCWLNRGGGMILFSMPGEGKTSALRKLAYYIGSGPSARRTVVVDERREFFLADYSSACVDVLRGYKKDKGIEIATRTLGAEVIIVDEIATDAEAEAILAAGMGGISVIATAHAGGLDELLRKRGVARLIENGFFSTAVRLYKKGGEFFKEATELAKPICRDKCEPSAIIL